MEYERNKHSWGVTFAQNVEEIHESIITILTPFSNSSHVQNFKIQLHMENATSNYKGKNMIFWSSDIDCSILGDDE